MRIKIESDVFDIVNRIKLIDKNYYVVYNTNSKKFEIHNSRYRCSYCLTIPYKNLDARTLNLIHKTSAKNYDSVVKDIDLENERLKKKQIEKTREISDYKINEILKYSESSSQNIGKVFETKWV